MSANPVPARPAFHDPHLRQALEEAAPAIEQFTAKLDRLSADIKNLEAFLEKSAVRMSVHVKFPEDGVPNDSPYGEFLAWSKGEPDRFRIIYYRVIHSGDYPEQRDGCVLIEAPVEIRVRARAMLPELLREVSQAATLGEDDLHEGTPSAGPEHHKEPWGEESAAARLPPPSDNDVPF